jgi:hypothetical protein
VAIQTPPAPLVADQSPTKLHGRIWIAVVLVAVLLIMTVGAGTLYLAHRGPRWEPYNSGDAGDFLRHYFPLTVTQARRTPGMDAAVVALTVRSDMSTDEGLQCAAYVGANAPGYVPLWGDAAGPVTYSTLNPLGADEIDLGTLRTQQTRKIWLSLAPRSPGNHSAITPGRVTAVCFAEHETTDAYLNQ